MDIEIPAEAKTKYIERRRQDLINCQSAITTSDFKVMEKVGHDLKGNAITFGFAPLSSVGESLEIAAREKNLENAKTAIKKMQDYLSTI